MTFQSDLFLSSRPRTELATTYITGYMVEARSVNNVKSTTTTTDVRLTTTAETYSPQRNSTRYDLFSPHILLTRTISPLRVSCLEKNQNAPRPYEHPPVRGGNVKTFRWDHRLQIQNLLMALLSLAFSVLVTNPKKLLHTVANPARGLLNREKRTKVWSLVSDSI